MNFKQSVCRIVCIFFTIVFVLAASVPAFLAAFWGNTHYWLLWVPLLPLLVLGADALSIPLQHLET